MTELAYCYRYCFNCRATHKMTVVIDELPATSARTLKLKCTNCETVRDSTDGTVIYANDA